MHAKSLHSCRTLCNPKDCSQQSCPVHGILWARILQGLLCPSPRDLPDPGIQPESPMYPDWQVGSLPLMPPGKPLSHNQFSSGQFSPSVVSDSLRPHESQHTRPPCSSPTPRVPPNSCASSQRCHPAISSSVVPFFSCPQSLPASGSFPMSQLFTWCGQSTGVSALELLLLCNLSLNFPFMYLVEIF